MGRSRFLTQTRNNLDSYRFSDHDILTEGYVRLAAAVICHALTWRPKWENRESYGKVVERFAHGKLIGLYCSATGCDEKSFRDKVLERSQRLLNSEVKFNEISTKYGRHYAEPNAQ